MEVKSLVAENMTNMDNKKKLVEDGGEDGKIAATASTETQRRKNNRIQVSKYKKPLFVYLNLAKRYIKQYNDVELSALGMAIPTVVTISEILKNNGEAFEKKISISSVGSKEGEKGRLVLKAQLEIVLGKVENLDETTAATAPVS